ncbi:MAG TPA: hypothetical protein PKW82_02225 [Spirochaetales bacterium]|nr:hypothetical protein [Spirochaetales bacterium]
MSGNGSGDFGKKVFFLHPPGVINDVAGILARSEFETYLVKDHDRLKRWLAKHPESIVFVNLDEGLPEPEWEAWVRAVMGDGATRPVGIGVVTLTGSSELSEKYLIDIGVACGFVVVKVGVAKTAEILLKTLEANEARGKRKFVRVPCADSGVELNFSDGERTAKATVLDLSVAGLACRFEEGRRPAPRSLLRGMHLSLKGVPLFADGIYVGSREDSGVATDLVMFDPRSLDDDKKDKIRGFGRKVLQARMDAELAAV